MRIFKLGQWSVSPNTNQISNESICSQLRPIQMQLLCLLVDYQGDTLTREVILEKIWPGRFGADEALSRTMSELRKALGDTVDIKTISKSGYCLLTKIDLPNTSAEINESAEGESSVPLGQQKKSIWKIAGAFSLLCIIAITTVIMLPNNQSEHESITVAILPLNNFTDSKHTGLLADGLIEEITHQLALNPKISVASRTSAFYFRDSPIPAKDIGKKLSVSHILEGSVRLTAKGYRITAQLIDTETGFHLWSKTFDSDNTSLISVQEQIAAQVRKLIGQSLAPQKAELSNELYEQYLLGVQAVAEFGPNNLQAGEAYFKTVLETHPNYTPAKIGLATSIIAQLNWGQINEDIGFLMAENLLNEVGATGDVSTEYYLARALLYSPKTIARKNTDRDKARQWYEKALEVDPNNGKVLQMYARYAPRSPEQAIELTKRAIKYDPYNALLRSDEAHREIPSSRADLFIIRGKEMIEQFPESPYGYFVASRAYEKRNDYVETFKNSYNCVKVQAQFMDCWAMLMGSLVGAQLYDQAFDIWQIASTYAPSLVTEFSLLKKTMKGEANQVNQLMQEVNVEGLNPVLTNSALMWAVSQSRIENLTEKQKLQYKRMTNGSMWHQQLYRFHWQRYKENDYSYIQELNDLIEEIETSVESTGYGHRWLLAALAMSDRIDDAFEFASSIPANHSIANFFKHFHLSINDPFLKPLHNDPRWKKWVAQHTATQKVIRTEILAIQNDFPLNDLKP